MKGLFRGRFVSGAILFHNAPGFVVVNAISAFVK